MKGFRFSNYTTFRKGSDNISRHIMYSFMVIDGNCWLLLLLLMDENMPWFSGVIWQKDGLHRMGWVYGVLAGEMVFMVSPGEGG